MPTTLTPEVNLDTATTKAAASTTLDVSSSVPEPRNTATTKDSVSTTEVAASTTLDASSSVPEQGKQTTDNKKPAPACQPFQSVDLKYDFLLRSFSNGKKQKGFNRDWFKNEDWKSWLHYNAEKDAAFCSTCINATRMNLIASKNADKAFISNGFTNWQDAGTKTVALTNTSVLRLTEKLTNVCLQYQMLVVIFLLSYLPRSLKQGR